MFFSLLLVSGEDAEKSKSSWKLAIGLGWLLGVTLLLRQLFLLVVPFLFVWIWWAGRYKKLSHPVRPLWIAGVVMVLMILPVTIYNYARFDRFVLLNTNAGYALFWGNHPIYGTKFVPILTEEMGSYQDLIPQDVRHLDEAAMDQALLKRSLQIILDDPGRYILLSISRIPPYFMFWPSRDSGMVSNISRVGSFGLFLPFMLYGLVLGLGKLPRGWRESLADPRVLLFGFTLLYTIIHLLTWTLIRYRLPVDAVLVIFAGVAIEDLARRFGLWRRDVPKFELNQSAMNILFISPYPPSLIRVRPYNLIRELSRRGHQVTVATLWSDAAERKDAEQIETIASQVQLVQQPRWRSYLNCVAALPSRKPLQSVYSWNPELVGQLNGSLSKGDGKPGFDLVHVEHLRGSRFGLQVKRLNPQMPVVWDSVDCISLLFKLASGRSKKLTSRMLTSFRAGAHTPL